ncbi:MAG: hypothetical protein ACC612_12170 [Methanomethylovorans sp.]|uniref:hypothetical protein n=1 Tax=Methanomethylovorans sp. TaxID=2758717 RepID=UPI0035315372
MRNQFRNILLIGILVISLLLATTANAQENTTTELTFGPETLDELRNDSNFIVSYGSIPSYGSLEERQQWLNELDKIYTETDMEISKYMYPDGPVTSHGYTINGVLEVEVNTNIEKPLMDEIYQIFDSKASQMGIKGVPVVFVYGDLAVPVAGEATSIVEKNNSSTSHEKDPIELNNSSNNNKSDRNDSNKSNYAPGLGILGSLICIYSGWKFRKM